ncbi:MAG: serine/threonine-protein kinase [Candidatus Altimarinota bacterium]
MAPNQLPQKLEPFLIMADKLEGKFPDTFSGLRSRLETGSCTPDDAKMIGRAANSLSGTPSEKSLLKMRDLILNCLQSEPERPLRSSNVSLPELSSSSSGFSSMAAPFALQEGQMKPNAVKDWSMVSTTSGSQRLPLQSPQQGGLSLPEVSVPGQRSGMTYYDNGMSAQAAPQMNGVNGYQYELMKDGFAIEKVIGQGGMGVVFKVRNTRVGNREEALKVITVPGSARDVDREAAIGGLFDLQEGLVRVNSAGVVHGNKYIAMPYLANVRDLEDLPEDLELLPRLVLCWGILKGMKSMHDKNVLHRDMKPANVLATGVENGDIMELLEGMKTYITDFGIALNIKQHETAGLRAGTPRFMSPEQIRKARLTLASDVFSAGLTLYEVITGTSPFPEAIVSDTDPEVVMEHISTLKGSAIKRQDRELLHLGLPKELHQLLCNMTHADPKKRPTIEMALQTFDEYLHELRPDVQEAQTTRRNKKLATWAAGVLGTVALSGLALLPGIKRGQRLEAFAKTHAQAVSNADSAFQEKKWTEAIALLKVEVERVEKNPDLGSLEKEEKVEALRKKLEQAETNFAALNKAHQLIAQGDALLNPVLANGQPDPNTPSDLDGARRKYREAQTSSNEVFTTVQQKLQEVDQRECRGTYTKGVRHYNRGEIDQARTSFADVDRLRQAGLNEQQQNSFEAMKDILDGWEEKLRELRLECVRVYRLRSFDEFKEAVDGWKVAALRGDRDAITKILELEMYLVRNSTTQDYENKFFLLYDAILRIESGVISHLQNPRAVVELQEFFMKNISTLRMKMMENLREGDFSSYQPRMMRLLDNAERMQQSLTENGQLIDLGGDGIDAKNYLSSIYSDVFSHARSLPPEEKKSLSRKITEKFSNSLEIMELVNMTLTTRGRK